MKSNQSSKNFKSVARVLTIALCVGLAFSLIAVQQTQAVYTWIDFVMDSTLGVTGVLIGWFTQERHDTTSPDALITSQENYVLVWNDFIEEWNNNYEDENVDLANYMMMYNLTYLDSVRRAEHDVASYVHLLNWSDVEENMTSLISYKENITKFITATLHGYNRIEVSILQNLYDTDIWSYTTPMKYSPYTHHSTGNIGYDWTELTDYGNIIVDTKDYQYKVHFGTYPVGFDSGGGEGGIPLKTGGYNIGEKFYVTYIYVPNGNFITLKNLESNVEITYSQGIHDLEGKANEVINVTIYELGSTYANERLDRTGVYLFGVPTDFDVLEDIFKKYNTGEDISEEPSSVIFEKSKYISQFNIYLESSVGSTGGVRVYVDEILIATHTDTAQSYSHTINDYINNISIVPFDDGSPYWARAMINEIESEGYIYHDMTGGLRVDTDSAGSVYITDNLSARARVGLDWMVDSYKSIYDGMLVNAQILWNLYHANGWYSTDDIPSEFLIVPPDIIFDNMDALKNLPLDKALAIYYAWMAQIIDFYDDNPDYAGTYDDTNMTVFDDGIIINATLIHGGKTIFENHEIYISPLLGDLEICKNNSYNLTQKIFIYDITGIYIYYGYVSDNLTIHNITIENVETDCVNLGRQTMQDFLLGKYGFSISFTGEWQFPEIENVEIYLGVAVACIVSGIIVAVASRGKYKKYKPIGYLLIVIGSGIIIYTYIIPVIQSFLDSLVFF